MPKLSAAHRKLSLAGIITEENQSILEKYYHTPQRHDPLGSILKILFDATLLTQTNFIAITMFLAQQDIFDNRLNRALKALARLKKEKLLTQSSFDAMITQITENDTLYTEDDIVQGLIALKRVGLLTCIHEHELLKNHAMAKEAMLTIPILKKAHALSYWSHIRKYLYPTVLAKGIM